MVGNQFPLVFQSVEPDEFQNAVAANVVVCAESKSKVAVTSSNDVCGFLKNLNLVFMLILIGPRRGHKPFGRGCCEKCEHRVKS